MIAPANEFLAMAARGAERRIAAAAPDLLAACKAALLNLAEIPGREEQWSCEQLRAAIAKAEARTEFT